MATVSRAAAGGGQGHRHVPRRTSTRGDTVDTEPENAGSTPSCRGRFLKVCDGNARGIQQCQVPASAAWAGNSHPAQSTPGSASHTRLSSVLSKVAQLESKIMSQRKHLELQNTDSGPKPLAEERTSSASGHKHGARGKKYRKNYSTTGGNGTCRDDCSEEEESIQSPKKNVMTKQQLDLDSDEEEIRKLMESPLGISSGNGNWKVPVHDAQWGRKSETPVPSGRPLPPRKEVSPAELSKASSFHNEDSEESVFTGRVNSRPRSPACKNLSGHITKDNSVKITLPKAGYTKQSQESLRSDGSEIKSLDELFSKGADAEDPTSSSSKYFRLNVLSLDDLAPDITSKVAEVKQKGKDIQVTQGSNKDVKKDTLLVEEDQAALKMTSAITGVSDSSEDDVEKSATEAEISERLSGVSSDFPAHKQDYFNQNERIVNSEYSEDFERSLSTTDNEAVERHAATCTCSGAHQSSASSPSVTRERHRRRRVAVTETAVQTAEPPFTYCWAKANPSAVLATPAGTSYVDPVPVASHVISMDAVEALTTYSPSVLVLHAMCKQHLVLTQQFVENVHHLHTSLVESLEDEKFHYHTLEEAKEYIKNHKSPPLTMEQALEEIRRAQEK